LIAPVIFIIIIIIIIITSMSEAVAVFNAAYVPGELAVYAN